MKNKRVKIKLLLKNTLDDQKKRFFAFLFCFIYIVFEIIFYNSAGTSVLRLFDF